MWGATHGDKILKGAKPADLPIEQPIRFDFAVNLKTAQALGIMFPNEILRQVTEVVQQRAVILPCAGGFSAGPCDVASFPTFNRGRLRTDGGPGVGRRSGPLTRARRAMHSRQLLHAPLLALAELIGLLLVPAKPVQADINFVAALGSAQANATFATTLILTTSADVPAGGSIIVSTVSLLRAGTGNQPPTAATCSDSAGHTYATDIGVRDPNTLTAFCSTHQITAPFSAGSSIYVDWTGGDGSQNERALAFAVTGLASNPLDRTATNGGFSTGVRIGPTARTSQSDELLVSIVTFEGGSAATAFHPGDNGAGTICNGNSFQYALLPSVGSFAPPGLWGMY
jgi:hypothetical protein